MNKWILNAQMLELNRALMSVQSTKISTDPVCGIEPIIDRTKKSKRVIKTP